MAAKIEINRRISCAPPHGGLTVAAHPSRRAIPPPVYEENYLVVLIHNPHSQLSFARVGDDKWTWLPPHTHYADCIYKDGILYAVNKVGEIHAFDLSGPVVTMKTIIEMVPGYACDKMYIVQAPWGDLLQVWRSYEYIEGDYEADLHDADPAISVENTGEIKIFVVDTVEKKRVEIENLDGHVLFLGHNQSLCLSTEQYPHLKENYTYFTDDNDLSLFGHKNNRRDIGLFDLKHNSREELVSPQLWSNFPAPVWITPSFTKYDTEAMYFDEDHTCPAFKKMLEHLHHVVLNKFKSDLDQSLRSGGGFAASAHSLVKHAVWDTTEVRGKLEHHIEAHATSVREKTLGCACWTCIVNLETGEKNSWACIRRLYRHATENAILAFSASLSEFELDQITIHKMVKELREHARSIVEEKARKEAGNVLMHFPLLSRDKDSMPRTWKGNEDISAITREARLAALRLMSVMAANRLDNKPDKIDRTLTTALLDGRPLSRKRSIEFASDPIVSSTWEECKSIWRNAETEYAVAEAISMQHTNIAIIGCHCVDYSTSCNFRLQRIYVSSKLSGLLTITSGFLPTIMDIITAVINISHNQKSSINSPL
uniref:Uncharacterized protein n=1 Tax=Oryza nivara TaxID=4536 RepID=A0A0E0GSZ2_ORYNI